jgi:hypothetical protein
VARNFCIAFTASMFFHEIQTGRKILMKTRWFTVVLIFVALIVGFGAGYFWRGPQETRLNDSELIDSSLGAPDTVLKQADSVNPNQDLQDAVLTGAGPADSYLPVFWVDVNTYAQKVHCYIRVPEHLLLKEKLEYFIGEVSRTRFRDKPIELVSIEQRNNKRIAIINLSESQRSEALRWSGSWYDSFQGSAGGSITSWSLVETFLQKDYGGEWVDGLQFLYNGNPAEFGHAEKIGGPHFRNP